MDTLELYKTTIYWYNSKLGYRALVFVNHEWSRHGWPLKFNLRCKEAVQK